MRKGFTLLELLIVLAIFGIIASIGLPAIFNLIHRAKIEGITRETAVLMRKARLEAIKQGVQTVVDIDASTGEIRAFADVHGLAVTDPPDGKYKNDSSQPRGESDYIIGTPYVLPNKVTFSFPGADAEAKASTFVNMPDFPDAIAIFQPNGSILNTGAIRFGDSRDNYLEVRVDPAATARIEIRKWNAAVSANPLDNSQWFAPGENDLPWIWY